MKRSNEYISWSSMKARCDSPKHMYYHNYGGRGIRYHPDWKYFKNFIGDMGVCPKGFTIERIDNNGDYTPDNCRWASKKEQSYNRRDNVWLTACGKTKIKKDWARELGVSSTAISTRLKKGQTMQEIYIYFTIVKDLDSVDRSLFKKE